MGKGGCAVPNCIPSKLDGRHRFPDLKKRRDMFLLWLQIINNTKLNNMAHDLIFKNCRICSKHFTLIDFGANHKLNGNALPSLHLQQNVTEIIGQVNNLPSTAAPSAAALRDHCYLTQQPAHEENIQSHLQTENSTSLACRQALEHDKMAPRNIYTQIQEDTEYDFVFQQKTPKRFRCEEADVTLGAFSAIKTPSDEIITRPTPTKRTYGRAKIQNPDG